MTNKQKQVNDQVNDMLQKSLILEQSLIKQRKPELASQIQAVSSSMADLLLNVSGVHKALHAYWQERKALAKGAV